MSKQKKSPDYEIFRDCFFDILGYTKREWDFLRNESARLEEAGYFNGDPFKCFLGAFVLNIVEEDEESIPDPAGSTFH